MKMEQLPPKLREKPFTLNEATKQGLSRYALNKLIAEGLVELVAHGVYRATQADLSEEDQYRIATLDLPPFIGPRKSIELGDEAQSFDKVWSELLICLKKLD